MRREFYVGLFLVLVTLALFGQVGRHDFIHYDDPEYVTENPHISGGLSLEAVRWAFSTGYAGNWHPVTWISHMVDISLFGQRSSAHHLMNVAYHLANVVLLFSALTLMTGSLWSSAFAAAIFALHPLQVESVAWVAERKNLLSTLFLLLTLVCYLRYVRHKSRRWYLLAIGSFCLGLMSKPMIVTLPFCLLLLDYWPLGRWTRKASLVSPGNPQKPKKQVREDLSHGGLIREKIPFLILSVTSIVVTYVVQSRERAVIGFEEFPIFMRFVNATVSYVTYLHQFLWPKGLAVFYPYPSIFVPWQIFFNFFILLAITILVIRGAARHPYLPVGWFWFFGTLVPVIGLVQVGMQSMADRYMYVPMIGLSILAAWAVPDLLRHVQFGRKGALVIAAGAALGGCLVTTWMQLQHWKNTSTLFTHALDVTVGNYVAHSAIGTEFGRQGRIEEAVTHYSEAVRLWPGYFVVHNNLGILLAQRGRTHEAIDHYLASLRLNPRSAETHVNLGSALLELGETEKALEHYREAVRLNPNSAEAYNGMGIAQTNLGQRQEAISSLTQAVGLQPESTGFWFNLGIAYGRAGQSNEAIRCFEKSLQLGPKNAQTHYNLGVALAIAGRTSDAIAHFQEAVQIKPDYADAYNNLGTIFATQGLMEQAIANFSAAVRVKPDFAEARKSLELALAIQRRRSRKL
jgi:tetratricopeptide (TPR) repeat protein